MIRKIPAILIVSLFLLCPPVHTQKNQNNFSELVSTLSEGNGYFDTDNLISNESSYLHVINKIRELNIKGGAYIGVGPDQNFSYIAAIRPEVAFIIDIRRDNMLQHLWYKALFQMSRNRIEYLALMFGKPLPENLSSWSDKSIEEITSYIDNIPSQTKLFGDAQNNIQDKIKSYGLKLSSTDIETITTIHKTFYDSGLALKFKSHNRASRSYYPTYRDLLLEKDLTSKRSNYLANEDDFLFVKNMEEKNLIIPVVGNLAGPRAMKNIAQYLISSNQKLSAFYTSNVEFYLMRDQTFKTYAQNVKAFPYNNNSVIIRSIFNDIQLPQTQPGYYSTQTLQNIPFFIKEFASGENFTYFTLVSK